MSKRVHEQPKNEKHMFVAPGGQLRGGQPHVEIIFIWLFMMKYDGYHRTRMFKVMHYT